MSQVSIMSLLLTGGREQMHASSDNDLREITPFKARIDELCLTLPCDMVLHVGDLKDVREVKKFQYGEGLAATHKLFADIMVFLQSTFPEEISNTHKGIFGLYDRFGNTFLTTVLFKMGEQEQTVTNAAFNPLCVDSTKSGLDWWLDLEFRKKEEILENLQRGLNISEKCGIRVKLLVQAYRMCVMAAEAKTPKHTQPTDEERLLQLEVAAIKRRAAAEAMVLAEAKAEAEAEAEAKDNTTTTTTTTETDAEQKTLTLETIQQTILELLDLTKTLIKNKEIQETLPHNLLLDF